MYYKYNDSTSGHYCQPLVLPKLRELAQNNCTTNWTLTHCKILCYKPIFCNNQSVRKITVTQKKSNSKCTHFISPKCRACPNDQYSHQCTSPHQNNQFEYRYCHDCLHSLLESLPQETFLQHRQSVPCTNTG